MRRKELLAMLAMTGCFYEAESPLPADFGTCTEAVDPAPGATDPTWYRDVEPIVVAKCQGCHVDGGIAPFALTTYEEVTDNRVSVADAVATGVMPPWQVAPCCNTYLHDRSLADAESATLLAWLDHGLPLGDPADHQIVTPPPHELPRVDLRAEMAVDFTPQPKIGADELRCFLFDHPPIDHDVYITGIDFQPGARFEVHHVTIVALDADGVADVAGKDGADGRPGWDCWGDGGELFGHAKFVGGWQPGDLPRMLPDGIGRELDAGSRIMVQIHYDTGSGIAPDRSALELVLEDRVERVERGSAAGNPLWFIGEGINIVAGDPDASTWFAWDPTVLTKGEPLRIHSVMLHMHELGSIGKVAILHDDGTTTCLLNIPAWDFHWMSDYDFAEPVQLAHGDKLYVECHWDNTAANQKIVNGVQQEPKDLHWSTDEEMCGAIIRYSEVVE